MISTYQFLPLTYLKGVGAVYLLILWPNAYGKREIKKQKKKGKVNGLVFAVKIGVTYRKKGSRIKEIARDMRDYGRVTRVPFSYFWMVGYQYKERRLHNHFEKVFRPVKAGPAAGKDEWRFLTASELCLAWIMLCSHHLIFVATNILVILLAIGVFIEDETKKEWVSQAIDVLYLLITS